MPSSSTGLYLVYLDSSGFCREVLDLQKRLGAEVKGRHQALRGTNSAPAGVETKVLGERSMCVLKHACRYTRVRSRHPAWPFWLSMSMSCACCSRKPHQSLGEGP